MSSSARRGAFFRNAKSDNAGDAGSDNKSNLIFLISQRHMSLTSLKDDVDIQRLVSNTVFPENKQLRVIDSEDVIYTNRPDIDIAAIRKSETPRVYLIAHGGVGHFP